MVYLCYLKIKQIIHIFETAKDLLEKYVKFINPKYAITKIRKFNRKNRI